MSKQVDLIYKLNGPKIDEGIDIFQLSPLLLSLGELIQESNSLIFPKEHKLGVNVKPFQKGSFIVELQLFTQNNFQQLLSAINSDQVQEIKSLLEWIGLTSGGGYGVIKIFKFLKGPPKRVKPGKDQVKIVAQNDNSITVSKESYVLFQNSKIQQSIYNIYGNFLGEDGVQSVESYIKDEAEKTKIEVLKSDVPYFNPANTVPTENDETASSQKNITKAFLKPKRISVEGEPDNWSFRKGGETVITVTIKDAEFLSKIKTGKIRLTNEDLLEVNLLEIQTVSGNEVNVKYELLDVLRYIQAPIQGNLL